MRGRVSVEHFGRCTPVLLVQSCKLRGIRAQAGLRTPGKGPLLARRNMQCRCTAAGAAPAARPCPSAARCAPRSFRPLVRCRAADSGAAEAPGFPTDSKGRYKRVPIRKKKEYQERVLRVDEIKRPLAGTRSNDEEKVQALMRSIAEEGQKVPIDVLEVEGRGYFGFSGCHRYEAHQRLGLETIRCYVYQASEETLRQHMA
ncbi:unnamed protein product [Pedinophyceae sp. YPF-701]|nr:unnamed protein product [Pedinophyceae sp. YPF-701]